MAKARRGAQSNTKPGVKPHVACISEGDAKANIQAKLDLLKGAILEAQSGGESGVLEGCPISRTKFNNWAPTGAASKPLTTNANATLKRYPDLLQSVDSAVEMVRVLRSSASSNAVPDRQARIEAARRSQRIHSTLRTIAERAAVGARREAAVLRQEVLVLKAAKDSAQNEFNRVLEGMRVEVQLLRDENASLIKRLRSVIPLGRPNE